MIVAILFNGLWQGALIVLATYAISKTISTGNASTRYALWYAALIALVAIPIAATLSDAGAQLLRAFGTRTVQTGYTVELLPVGRYVEHARGWFESVASWIVVAWLIGVGINLARLAVSFVRVERIRQRAQPLPLAEGDVYVSRDVAVPIVAGIASPRIIVPPDISMKLSAEGFRQVIVHERAHVVRNDALWNLVQRVIEAVLFFNPWVRIAGAMLSGEREAACDDWVVAQTGSAGDYAACLATIAQTLRTQNLPLLTAGAYRSRRALVTRIERLNAVGHRRLTVNRYALGGTIVFLIVIMLALQAFSPALALTPAAQAGPSRHAGNVSRLAAACSYANTDAQVVKAAMPSLPHGFKAQGVVNVAVTISPTGQVTGTKVLRSSGNASVDDAVVEATRHSTYSPKLVNCTPVEGAYIFHAEFAP